MKTLFLFAALLFAVTLSSVSLASNTTVAGKKHKAVMQFSQPVELMNVILQGEYLFVHDDAAMARGEVCTFVYKGTGEVANKLVASFHCTPAERTKVGSFTVRTNQPAPGITVLSEFQFGGETEAHVVPAK